MQSQRLFLLDAYALIFRAYYALIRMPRMTSEGFNTSAIFGFVNTLEELLRKERPTHMAVCFDPAGPTFRSEAYDAYKGERAATPEDIRMSVPIIKEIVKAYNIRIVEADGFEADDVIGSLAKLASGKGFITYMMTPDKDYGQLVGPDVLQYKPSHRGQDFEVRGVKEICGHYGIRRPEQIIDLLALMGDKVDNIPGCPGVGEVKARKLLAEYDNVENLLENATSVKGALGRNLVENSEQIRFSKFLATIRTDVPLDVRPEDLTVGEIDRQKLFAIFDSLEFRTLRQRVEKRLKASGITAGGQSGSALPEHSLFTDADFEESVDSPGKAPGSRDIDMSRYITVETTQQLTDLSERLGSHGRVGVSMVVDGDNDVTACWRGTAIAIAEGEVYFLPEELEEGKDMVLGVLGRKDMEKVTSSAKRDAVIAARMRNNDVQSLANYYDVTLAHYLLQPEMRHDIDQLASNYMHVVLPQLPAPPRKSDSPYSAATPGQIALRACAEADVILRLRDMLAAQLDKEGMTSLLEDIELPLALVLADMELTGVRIDVDALNEAASEMQHRIASLENEIYSMAGMEFNIASPAKVGEVLFDRLNLEPRPKKTKSGHYSTSEEMLEKVLGKHPIVGMILQYRQLKKLLTTYLLALPASINPATGKIHTTYNQSITATGRISSSNPNLQNIPVREAEGRDIRRAFIADEGCLFLSADYSQIELRLVADFSGDATMLDAFAHEQDIHTATAAKIYHKEAAEVSAEERRHAKTANFGILYGISAFGLANRLGIPRSEAKILIDNYFASFPDVDRYISKTVEQARQDGYVVTPMGRKRRLPDINSRNPTVRGYAERNAVNAPIQGFAADIIKKAMVTIWGEMRRRGLKSRMTMQVHDELNFNVEMPELAEVQRIVVEGMQSAYSGRVSLTASCGVAGNWLDAH